MEPHTALWRRLDVLGKEACLLTSVGTGWQISGVAVFDSENGPWLLTYVISCDEAWRTLSAEVRGSNEGRDTDVRIVREPSGIWRLNGDVRMAVEGCVDIDLNFSPSTNLIPIRRLDLAVGESAGVRAAWLRFPSFELEPLDQSYTRVGTNLYRYESAGGSFVAPVEVDDQGLVRNYGEIWQEGWEEAS